MTPCWSGQLVLAKSRIWSDKITIHCWRLWWYMLVWLLLIYVDFLKFKRVLSIYCRLYCSWHMKYIGIYWNILKCIEIYWNMFFQRWKTKQYTKPINTIYCFHRLVVTAFFGFFQGGWSRKWSWYQRHFTVFFSGLRHRRFSLVCKKHQSYFNTSPGWMHHKRWLDVCNLQPKRFSEEDPEGTVDGRNPAPPGMYPPKPYVNHGDFYYPNLQLVSLPDFWTINSITMEST